MGRPALGLLVIVATVGGWLVTQNEAWYQVTASLANRVTGTSAASRSAAEWPTGHQSIRIATFDLNGFGREQLEQDALLQLACRVMERFDVLALQNIVSAEAFIVPTIVDSLNARGNTYDFVVSERTGREPHRQQFAFLFRPDQVVIDRGSVYRVLDPDDLLSHEPFVASFRTTGVHETEAFTFSLVNILISDTENEAARERAAMWDVWRAVAADGRGEDDVILLGNFRAPVASLKESIPSRDSIFAIVERPTDLVGNRQSVNLAFSRRATVEFTGRTGVFDLVREFNISLDQAGFLSASLPTWAEFSLQEGSAAR